MLKLLWCEFAKLRRKPLFFAAAAVSALIPLGCALFLPDFQEFTSGAEAVDGMMSTLFKMSAYLLLMPALVVLASNLLFEEQDNDTLKNLMTVPVSKPTLALAKMALLFLFSIAFMAVGGLVILLIVLATGWEPVGFGRVSITSAQEHDKRIAFTSQMAHIISNAYIKSPTARQHDGFSAGSYKDLTRVAWLNPDMWAELFLENRENLLFELGTLIEDLTKYKDAIERNDFGTLRQLLDDGRRIKEEVDGK